MALRQSSGTMPSFMDCLNIIYHSQDNTNVKNAIRTVFRKRLTFIKFTFDRSTFFVGPDPYLVPGWIQVKSIEQSLKKNVPIISWRNCRHNPITFIPSDLWPRKKKKKFYWITLFFSKPGSRSDPKYGSGSGSRRSNECLNTAFNLVSSKVILRFGIALSVLSLKKTIVNELFSTAPAPYPCCL